MAWVAAAAAWGFAEATLFFVVPDVLLTWIAAFRPRRAAAAVGACLAGALLGGALMFGAAARDPVGTRALVERTEAGMSADYRRQMLLGGLSGVPYKVMAIAAAARDGSPSRFLAWSVPARLPRWIALALLARGVAAWARRRSPRAERWLPATWASLWGLVYLVYFSIMDG